MNATPWASFCMSTYKRPEFLSSQVSSLLRQTFQDFEIVISDNDPEASGRLTAESFNDPRVKYETNKENLGMVKSFNKSIERALGKYIVMVTDDDPVEQNFLSSLFEIINKYPGYSLYGGFGRSGKSEGFVEVIDKENFLAEVLDPSKTHDLLWSSCLLHKEALLSVGKLADYGGPHLVDHAMMAMVGSVNGGIMINRMYSSINSHQSNYSKSNLEVYYYSCKGFYGLLNDRYQHTKNQKKNNSIIKKHLARWFIVSMFNLRKHYFINNKSLISEIDTISGKIMKLPFMKRSILKYRIKLFIFYCKANMRLIS